MRYELLHQPSFTVARVMLEVGQAVRAESGAMVSMSHTIQIEAKTGGLGKMFGRLLGGESVFQTTFTATTGPGEVVLTPPSPGDVLPIEMTGNSIILTSGSFLACDSTLEMGTVASMKGFFGGEGLFMLRVSGHGTLLASAFGAIYTVQLQPGQPYIVDTGHLVAFTDGMGYSVKTVSRGIFGTIASGEGLVAEMTGPGIVHIQTRTPSGFAQWLGGLMPR